MAATLDDVVNSLQSMAGILSNIDTNTTPAKKPAAGTGTGGSTGPDPKIKAAQDRFASAVFDLTREIGKVAEAGIKFAGIIGTSATRGVQLEINNRNKLFGQIFTAERDRIVSAEQLRSAQEALASTFISTREGYQLSAGGARNLGAALKGGFKSDFQLTGDAMKALITAGVSTEAGFENLRKSSGRASLTHTQLATLVNKNSLSFMLYGPRFAKAAAEAEKLGISLASVQSAQESMVTNLDGTIDTIAQINQLGGQIDFGTLTTLNETQGPEATLKYLQSTLPPALFQSASTRALLKGFGISVEDLMKGQQSAQASAADQMEKTLSELPEPVGVIAKILTEVSRRMDSFLDSWGYLILSFGKLTLAVVLAGSAILSMGTIWALLSKIPKLEAFSEFGKGAASAAGAGPAGAGPAGGVGAGAAGTGTTIGGFLRSLAQGLKAMASPQALLGLAAITAAIVGIGYALKVAAPGIVALGQAIKSTFEGIGSIIISIGTAIGSVVTAVGDSLTKMLTPLATLSPATIIAVSGAMIALSLSLGSFAGAAILAAPGLILFTNRMASLATSASGIQILSTSFNALVDSITKFNELDTSKLDKLRGMAGPTVAPTGGMITDNRATLVGRTTTTESASNGELTRKIDELITVLRNAKTVINVDNKVQEVPRNSVVGVYTRNERRS